MYVDTQQLHTICTISQRAFLNTVPMNRFILYTYAILYAYIMQNANPRVFYNISRIIVGFSRFLLLCENKLAHTCSLPIFTYVLLELSNMLTY